MRWAAIRAAIFTGALGGCVADVGGLECPEGTAALDGRCVDGTLAAPEPEPERTGEFTVTPLELQFGEHVLGTSSTETVEVYNPGPDRQTLRIIPSRPSAFTVVPEGTVTLAPDEALEIVVTFAPLTAEEVRNFLRIDTCEAGCSYTILLQGIGLNQGDIGAFTCTVGDLGRARIGQCAQGNVGCFNGTGRVRRVVGVEFQPAGQGFADRFEQEPAFPAGSPASIPIEFCPTRAGLARVDMIVRLGNGDAVRNTVTGIGE